MATRLGLVTYERRQFARSGRPCRRGYPSDRWARRCPVTLKAVDATLVKEGRHIPAVAVIAANMALVALGGTGLIPLGVSLAVAIAALVAILQRPQRGLLLLAALAPFSGLLLILDLPPFVAAWKEALVLVSLGATFMAPPDARGRPNRRPPDWTWAVVGLGLIGLLSAAAVGGLQAVIGLKIGFFYILVAVVAWRCPLSPRERDLLVSIIMVTAIVTSAVGLLQQVAGGERLNAMGYEYNETIRYSGNFLRSFSTFTQPFPFGFFVSLAVLIGIPVALNDPHRRRNRIFLMCTPLLALGVLSTFVRGAWLALAVGLVYLASRRYRVLLLLIPVALLTLALLPPDVSSSAFSSKSSKERTESWLEHSDLVTEHPLGAGIGSTGSASEKVAEALRDKKKQYQPDNYYFKVLVELGVLGLWFFVLLMVYAFRFARHKADQLEGSDAGLAEGTSASILASAAAAMVATYFEIFPLDLYFWLLLGVLAACGHDEEALTAAEASPQAGATKGPVANQPS